MARKRKRRERQREPSGDVRVSPNTGDAPPEQDWRLPSPMARIAGGALAVLTLVIAVGTIVTGLSDDLAPIDVGVRLVVGLLLIALAIAIAALAIVPARVRGLIVRD